MTKKRKLKIEEVNGKLSKQGRSASSSLQERINLDRTAELYPDTMRVFSLGSNVPPKSKDIRS